MPVYPTDTQSLLQRLEQAQAENLALRQQLENARQVEVERERDRRRLALTEQLGNIGTFEWIAEPAQANWSEGLYRLLGFTPGEKPPTIRSLLSRIATEDRHKAIMLLRKLRQTGQQFSQTLRIALPNQSISHIHFVGFVERREGGEISRLFAVIQDVSESISSRTHLQLQQRNFLTVFEQSPVAGVITRSKDGHITAVNRAFEQLTGHRAGNLIGCKAEDYPQYFDIDLLQLIEQRQQHTDIDNLETVFNREDGSQFPALLSATEIETEEGPCRLTYITDLTALRNAESAFRRAFEALPMPAMLINSDNGVVVQVNEAFCSLFQVPAGDVTGRIYTRMQGWTDTISRKKFVEELEDTREVNGWETNMTRRDGSEFSAFVSAHTVDLGSAPHDLVLIQDISAIKDSEELFQAVFNADPDACLVVRLSDNQIILVNDGFTRITGYPRSEALHNTAIGMGLWVDLEAQKLFRQRLAVEGSVRGEEILFRRRDGTIFSGRMNATLVFHRGERCLIADVVDLSIEQSARQAAAQERQRFSQLVEASPVAIAIFLPTTNIIEHMNPAFAEMFRRMPHIQGQALNVEEIWPDAADRQWFREKVASEGEVQDHEIRLDTGGSALIDVRISATLLRQEGKLSLILFLTDITDRRRLEVQVQHKQKMEAVGQLAGGVAHDFNNLLTSMSGFTELLLTREVDQQTHRRYLRQIAATAQRATELTNQLLMFSRRGAMQNKTLDVHDLINDTVLILQSTLDRRVVIKRHLDAHNALIVGDESQLSNALINLCINAGDAMPDGGGLTIATELVTIESVQPARTRAVLRAGDYLKITVSDTGCGMEAELLDTIFEPFFTTKEPGKGTGLGLAAVYGSIEAHAGTIAVDSTPGQGSEFAVFLPSTSERRQETRLPSATLTHGSGTVLVVDDEASLRDLICDMLDMLGYRTLTASDGQEALETYQKEQDNIDLVFLDMTMPRMNGRQAVEELKAINPDVAILLTSGNAQGPELDRALQAGAQGLVKKPFDLPSLSAALAEAFKNVSTGQ